MAEVKREREEEENEQEQPRNKSFCAESSAAPEGPRLLWCLDCRQEGGSNCDDLGHDIRGLAAYFKRQAGPRLEQLQQLEAALLARQELYGTVLAAAQRGLEKCGQRLERVRDCAQGLRTGSGSDTWQEKLQHADQLLQGSEEQQKVLRLLREEQRFTLSSAAWRAEAVSVQENPGLRMSLLRLLEDGNLQKNESDFRRENVASEETDLSELTMTKPEEKTEEKAALFLRNKVLRAVSCDSDPGWVQQLLIRQADTLQELELCGAEREHLLALQAMPQLRALWISGGKSLEKSSAPLHVLGRGRGLQRLVLRWGLPKHIVQSLLAAHRNSLEELDLWVGPPPPGERKEKWPDTCSDLHALLGGLQQLRHLALNRRELCDSRCRAQLAALRSALPGCEIQCDFCLRRSPEAMSQQSSQRIQVLHALRGSCQVDPAWVLQLLERHSATLQELALENVSREHLLAVQRMPQLRALLVYAHTDLDKDGDGRPALPEEWQGEGLQRLELTEVPERTVRSLLHAHRHSLRELALWVGPPPEEEEQESWPGTCSDLPALLGALQQLRRVSLWRPDPPCDSRCGAQQADLGAALPRCSIACSGCLRRRIVHF